VCFVLCGVAFFLVLVVCVCVCVRCVCVCVVVVVWFPFCGDGCGGFAGVFCECVVGLC